MTEPAPDSFRERVQAARRAVKDAQDAFTEANAVAGDRRKALAEATRRLWDTLEDADTFTPHLPFGGQP